MCRPRTRRLNGDAAWQGANAWRIGLTSSLRSVSVSKMSPTAGKRS